MKTAIATVCLSGGLDEKLRAIANAGFKGVEIFENDLLSFNGTPLDIRRAANDLGLEIVTFQPFRDFEGMPARQTRTQLHPRRTQIRSDARTRLRSADGLLQRLAGKRRWHRSRRRGFSRLGERAAQRGMRVGFEALAWGRHINDYRDAWEVVRRADHPAVGLVLDSFHILSRKTDLQAMTAVPRDRIFLVQLADAPVPGNGFSVLEPAFPQFPRPGRFSDARFHDRAAADRLRRTAVAGDFQRSVPRRLGPRASPSMATGR